MSDTFEVSDILAKVRTREVPALQNKPDGSGKPAAGAGNGKRQARTCSVQQDERKIAAQQQLFKI